ncbi:MAG: insulinase family protein, partial [Rhodothermales bacterium]|nr:insulinase family protein [Rhodothermales bacterium]
IGEMEDLDAASLDDVHEWFKTYYGPNNAVLVLAGDITVEEARKKAQHFFGDIPPSPPIAKQAAWISKRSGEHRLQMEDRVPQARIYKVWNVPEWGHPELTQLDLASDVLSAGKSSRLYKRLVYDDQIATSVYAYVSDSEIGGRFTIVATAKPGQDLSEVEKAVDEELRRFIDEGPTQEELDRVRTGFFSDFIRGMERIGGFGGKSDILAENEVYGGSPDFYKKVIRRVEKATTGSVHDAAKKWLSDGVLVIEVHPFQEGVAASEGADRSGLPDVGPQPLAAFPKLQHATLSNGLKVVLAERHAVPVVNLRLMMDAGYASDQFGLAGTASLAMNMLDEGTTTRSALEISDELELLGAQLSSGSDLDNSVVRLSALKWNLGPSLDLFADVILRPSFPDADFERLKAQQIARIQREKATPIQMALRVFPRLLYGEDHAYGNPLTGSGTEESVGMLSRSNLVDFHETWFRPNNATLVVAGDVSLAEIIPMLEDRLAEWPAAPVPTKNIAAVPQKSDQVIYLMDRPGSQQSIIFAGHVAPPTGNPDELAIETMMDALGGSFTSRINMNLREAKGWSYGAFAFMFDAEGQRPFVTYAPVQSDKTKESMAEISAELHGMKGDKPVTSDEVGRAKDNLTLTLPGRWETLSAVEGGVAEIVRFGLDDDYWDTYAESIRSLSESDVSDAAAQVLYPGQLVWVVVGDRATVEPAIRELGYGSIELIDADGMSVSGGAQQGL